ncbi:histone H1B-like [Anabrus simplex]|uniref:histone H1B-like n=1 Tax=Anabrus simplex TaxID=316456 RepID=UPI0035A2F40F
MTPCPKKLRQEPGNVKMMLIVAYDVQGVIVHHAVPTEPNKYSLQTIKKYISANYKVDSEKLAPFIKEYLKSAVASGELVQTKGKGASGSFKLASAAKPEKASAAPVKRSTAPKEKRIPKAKKAAKVPTKEPKAPKPKRALTLQYSNA